MVRGWVGVENCWLLQLLLLRVGRSLGNYTFAITNHYVFLNRGKFHWRLGWFWKLVAFNHYYSLRGRGSVKMFEFCITLITGWVGSRKTTNFALRNFEIFPNNYFEIFAFYLRMYHFMSWATFFFCNFIFLFSLIFTIFRVISQKFPGWFYELLLITIFAIFAFYLSMYHFMSWATFFFAILFFYFS